MEYIVGFIIGLLVGAGVAVVVVRARRVQADRQLREAFAALAGEALDANTRRLTETAESQLDGKKALIDQAVRGVAERLEQVRQTLQKIEAERREDVGKINSSVTSLATTAGELHRMLASTQRRGAWGERMAGDILRLAGLVEGVNYSSQSSADAEQGRPDFTFFLPNGLKCNMDVKFPLAGYKSYVDAETDAQRAVALRQLAQDVRGHVRAVASRGYVDPKAPTVPYAVVFIASEQVFSLVLAESPDLIDEALGKQVVLASPLTLYAMLSVIRQAAESANLMKTADEVITLVSAFNKQYQLYCEMLDKLGSQLDTVSKTYEALRTTRTNMLQKPLDKIEELRTQRGLGES